MLIFKNCLSNTYTRLPRWQSSYMISKTFLISQRFKTFSSYNLKISSTVVHFPSSTFFDVYSI
ncbi:hypothetical protein CW304_18740 [Bacillus sp. UFRGS-B20]|nr:hypothetical protein CW304_18740 [Bacillus sp. UFRGS-B20]